MGDRLTTCTFCGAGCGLYLETSGGAVVGAYPSRSHPSSAGRLCVRGWHAHEIASAPDRLRVPLVRRAGRLVEASWDEALDLVARRLREVVARHGPESVAVLCSPRSSNEESYLLQKLARAVLGTPNVDHGAGVHANDSLEPLLATLGVPGSTASIADLDLSEVIVIDGVDLARQLPTVGGRVLRAKLRGAKLVVIGERRHRLAEHAALFLQTRPGTEALLYGAMAKVVLDRGLEDRAFTERRCTGFEAFAAEASRYDLLEVAEECGVAAADLEAAALAYARARTATVLSSTAEQRGPAVVRALVNLALLTGHLGKEGSGLLVLAEHNNLQGVCDMGMLPARLPGYRAVGDAAARAELGRQWGADLPAGPGLDAAAVLDGRGGGRVRALWLCGLDPVGTASRAGAERALEGCELVVVQHAFETGSSRRAHVLLPTAAFGEERVTFTSAERRIQLADQAIDPPPGVTPAWAQVAEVARRLGAPWNHRSSAEVLEEIALVVPFYGAARQERLAGGPGLQWPCGLDRPLGTRTLLAEAGGPAITSGEGGDASGDGAGGRAGRMLRFSPLPRPAPRPAPDPAFPLTLVFGHASHHWNEDVLVQHSETLRREHRILLLDYPAGFVELCPDDAATLGIRDGERVRVCAAGGSAVTAARVTAEARPGALFAPFFVREVREQILGGGPADQALVPVRLEKEAP